MNNFANINIKHLSKWGAGYSYKRTALSETLVDRIKNVNKKIKNLKNLTFSDISNIKKEKTVYFHSSVIYPRSKFKSDYECKLSRIENADIIIIDPDRIREIGFDCDKYYVNAEKEELSDGDIVYPKYSEMAFYQSEMDRIYGIWRLNGSDIQLKKKVIYTSHSLICETQLKNLESLFSSKAIFIDAKDLIPSFVSEEISKAQVDKIKSLLKSQDPEMRKLGTITLSGFNYKVLYPEILAICCASGGIFRLDTSNIECKTMVMFLKKKFEEFNLYNKLQTLESLHSFSSSEIVLDILNEEREHNGLKRIKQITYE